MITDHDVALALQSARSFILKIAHLVTDEVEGREFVLKETSYAKESDKPLEWKDVRLTAIDTTSIESLRYDLKRMGYLEQDEDKNWKVTYSTSEAAAEALAPPTKEEG